MLYRTMPKIDEKLSVLGFGCMRLPVNPNYTINEPRAIKQIRYAADHGVNYFDTAWPYHGGKSEPLLGKALEDGYRRKVNIATKLPSWMVNGRKHMDYFLNEQLKMLQTDHIDFYLIHNLAGPIWDKMMANDILEFVDKAKQSGKIRYAGFSFHGMVDDFEQIVDAYPWEFCQIQYNYLDEVYQAGTRGLKYAASKGLGIIIMEPLRGGSMGLPEPPPDVAGIWEKASEKRTPAEWALRWVMDHSEVTTVLSGMNVEAHVEENIRIAGNGLPNALTKEEHDLIKEASDTFKRLMKVDCTGCEYCKPCPEGVDIPAIFKSLNKFHLYKNEEESKFIYALQCSGMLSGKTTPVFGSDCVQCEECLKKCPQDINIPKFLAEAAKDLEDDQMDNRITMARKMFNM